MRKLRHSSLISILVALTSAASAMNNADVIKMKKADFSDATILMTIEKEPAEYDTSPKGLIELKEAGLSETVIQKIVARSSGGQLTAPAEAAPEASPPSSAPAAAAPSAPLPASDTPSIAPPFIDPAIGKDYFTRFTLHEEKREYPITNYARGELVPINTRVTLLSISDKKIVLKRHDNGEQLTVENIEKYSHKSPAELARVMLSAEPTPLDRLPQSLASSIRAGEMRIGMTKEQVLMARGYPPAHETSSLDSDRWVYWSSRFVKQTIVFNNGRLVEGRGLY